MRRRVNLVIIHAKESKLRVVAEVRSQAPTCRCSGKGQPTAVRSFATSPPAVRNVRFTSTRDIVRMSQKRK